MTVALIVTNVDRRPGNFLVAKDFHSSRILPPYLVTKPALGVTVIAGWSFYFR